MTGTACTCPGPGGSVHALLLGKVWKSSLDTRAKESTKHLHLEPRSRTLLVLNTRMNPSFTHTQKIDQKVICLVAEELEQVILKQNPVKHLH